MWPRKVENFLDPTDLKRLPRRWHTATVVDDMGNLIEDDMRKSEISPLRNGALIKLLTHKMRAQLERDDLKFREGTFVRYRPGDCYSLHGDAAGLTSGRDFTLLVGVVAATRGGATHFPHLHTSVYLQPGIALIWPNYKGGVENEQMDHEAKVVEEGTKIVINAWFDITSQCQR